VERDTLWRDMTLQALITLLYGLGMAGGGYAGYRVAGSRPSLAGGAVIGGLAVVGSVLMFLGRADGKGLALLGASLAILFFGWRLSQALLNRKPIGRAAGILLFRLLEVWILVFSGGKGS
jgi:uncharacterized membrane protein (UPF0136 family)